MNETLKAATDIIGAHRPMLLQKLPYVSIEQQVANIKDCFRRGLPKLEPADGQRDEEIAVVCFGPSLVDTWERLKSFETILTCSGAHKFLLERGIVPTYHAELDSREHKIGLLGTPHPDTTYLIASACHPKYFDYLVEHKANIRIWTAFENSAEIAAALEPGQWALTGGCDVGQRSLMLAAFMGYSDIHVFGMDGSVRGDKQHASSHPNEAKPEKLLHLTYNGEKFSCGPAQYVAATTMWRRLNDYGFSRISFYGDGLVQRMAKEYQPGPPSPTFVIGFQVPDDIKIEDIIVTPAPNMPDNEVYHTEAEVA